MEEVVGPFLFDHMAVKGGSGEVSAPDEEQLPFRRCEVCRQEEWHPQLARYGLGVPPTLDRKLFTTYHVLSIEEFEEMLQSFPVGEAIRNALLPGTRIGNPTFKLLTQPRDFVAKGTTLFVSERTVDVVRARNLQIELTPVNVSVRPGRPPVNYYYINPYVEAIMDPEWLKIEMAQCWRCGNWWPRPEITLRKQLLNKKAQVLAASWPDRAAVVYSKDIMSAYYSREFVQACIDAKLSGAAFEQVSWS